MKTRNERHVGRPEKVFTPDKFDGFSNYRRTDEVRHEIACLREFGYSFERKTRIQK